MEIFGTLHYPCILYLFIQKWAIRFIKNSKLGNNKHTVIGRVSFMFILNEEFNLNTQF